MVKEVLDYLDLAPGKIILDMTVGTGGHSLQILQRIIPSGKLIGLDRDKESLDIARDRLSDFRENCIFVHSSFSEIDVVLRNLNIQKVDAILFDLGISSFQLEDPRRGFTFQKEGPLDMRLDRTSFISAYDLLNNLNKEEISSILWTFGQERWHNRIAHLLVKEREKRPISTTSQLSDIVLRALPYRQRYHRIHPATRTFQAVRIAVNRELEVLQISLNKAVEFLNPNAKFCVISFHSLEDRIVKLTFRKFASLGRLQILTPKPLRPALAEIQQNPSSRSARLRVARRV